MRKRHRLWILLVLALFVGCGDEGGTTDKEKPAPGKDGGAKSPAIAWGVRMTFDVDVEAAKKAGRIPADRDAAEVLEEVTRITRDRLRAAEVGKFGIDAEGRRLEVGFATLPAERRDEIVALIIRSGTLEFLIEVLPDAEYRKRLDPSDDAPARLGLWKGSAADFGEFKKQEIRAWKTAQATGEYKPTMPGYRLARDARRDGSADPHFHLLESPSEQETFDGRMLKDPAVSQDVRGMPTIVFEVRKDWQKRFEAWTKKNVLLPMAIVLDGLYHSAPTIRAPLSTHVQITLGAGKRSDQRRDAKALVIALQAGALPVVPKLVSIVER